MRNCRDIRGPTTQRWDDEHAILEPEQKVQAQNFAPQHVGDVMIRCKDKPDISLEIFLTPRSFEMTPSAVLELR